MSAFFSASNNGWQLYKLGDDQSVTQWTADAIGAVRPLNPFDLTAFNGSVWFDGDTGGGQGRQLYKLGSDGSVTLGPPSSESTRSPRPQTAYFRTPSTRPASMISPFSMMHCGSPGSPPIKAYSCTSWEMMAA